MSLRIGSHLIGNGQPCFIVAELGANHGGDVAVARQMIDAAKAAGVDAVKFQIRTPEVAIPLGQQVQMRSTPWGEMRYLDYRRRLELSEDALSGLAEHAKAASGLECFASVWDELALSRCLRALNPPCVKIPSACLTDDVLLRVVGKTDRPVLVSTGMSTRAQIDRAVLLLDHVEHRLRHAARPRSERLLLMHCKSAYPTPPEDLNLGAIRTLHRRYGGPVGYSGHEVDGMWAPTLAAVVMGALAVERHFTLDRRAWGTDQSCSLEPAEMAQLVQAIRQWERARGDGTIRVLDSEKPVIEKLRRVR